MAKQLFLTAILGLLLTSFSFAQEAANRGFLVEVGESAPDFTAQLTNGEVFKLSEARGKVVMLQFTASWCSVCRREMPYIEKDIWAALKDKNFVLIGVDRDEPLDVVNAYVKQMKTTYPMALDPNADIFGLFANKESGVTRNVIINANGKIIYLSRLFNMDEFNEMKAVIFEAVEQNK